MNKLIFEVISLGLILLLFGCTPDGSRNEGTTQRSAGTEQKMKTVTLPRYTIYKEEIYDVPLKTQVTLHVVIDEDSINEDMIRALLNHLYSNTMSRTGFDYRTNPSSAYIYVYTSKEKAKSGMGQWVGMISKSHADTQPGINISDMQMEAMNEIKESKWGLTYEQRQEIWNKIIKLEDRAMNEADKKFPLDRPDVNMDDINRNTRYKEKLKEKYMDDLTLNFKVQRKILDSVSLEGLSNGWAFPEYE